VTLPGLMSFILASATTRPRSGGSSIASVIGWSLVLIVLVLGAFVVVMRVKSWLTADDDAGPAGAGFTLSDLRTLHRSGKMTDEEFERARAQMMAGAKAMADKLPDPLARPGEAPRPRPPLQRPPTKPAQPRQDVGPDAEDLRQA
jgi:hypothetical protein